ncbi:hypothetical protein V8E51_016286 [Hyaloscypha variabilis]|jgi:hypothetical protein
MVGACLDYAEAAVVRELCIICGRYSLPWNRFYQIYPVTVTKPGQFELSPHEKKLKPLRRLKTIRYQQMYFNDTEAIRRLGLKAGGQSASHQDEAPVQFSQDYLISTFQSSQVMDPRDKIHALLGLASDRDKVILDYTMSKMEVYLR